MPLQPTFDELVRISRRGCEEYRQALHRLLTSSIRRRMRRVEHDRRSSDLFRPENEFMGPVDPAAFTLIADPDDRKFAALSAAAQASLVTNDNLVLAQRGRLGIEIATPRDFLARLANKG